MYLNETYARKWAPVLDHGDLPKITDPYKRAVTALVLENQERALMEESRSMQNLWEAGSVAGGGLPNNVGGGMSPVNGGEGAIKGFDPILIGLVRRALPNLMAYDICGVQPMTGPTGLIFAMRSTYASATARAGEALYNEANTGHSGNAATGTQSTLSVNPGNANSSIFGLDNTGPGFSTSFGESANLAQMGFQIDRVAVTANTRGLQASYTLELAQDLKAIHGLDAETELTNILSTEILAEINREVVRTVYATANAGITNNATGNVFNLSSSSDTSGRWQVEKYKSLLFAIERAANKIAKDTRRGKGNMVIVSTDVASALAMTGLLDYNSALTGQTNLTVDDTGNTFAGTLFGRIKVYVDPYSVSGTDYCVVGYKGTNAYDAGLFYCPYVPLQMVRAIDPQTYQPKVGFKTRYGLVANPFATGAGTGALANDTNMYYRKFVVLNINQ
jgi:Major capsid protein Gp23